MTVSWLAIPARNTSTFVVVCFLVRLSGNAYVGFEVVNSPFDVSSYFIEGIPFRGIPLGAAEHKLNERFEFLEELGKKRGIRDFGKAAEIH